MGPVPKKSCLKVDAVFVEGKHFHDICSACSAQADSEIHAFMKSKQTGRKSLFTNVTSGKESKKIIPCGLFPRSAVVGGVEGWVEVVEVPAN